MTIVIDCQIIPRILVLGGENDIIRLEFAQKIKILLCAELDQTTTT